MEIIIVSGLWENSHSYLIMVINLNRPMLTWNVYTGLWPEPNLSMVVLGRFPCTLTVDAILLSLHFITHPGLLDICLTLPSTVACAQSPALLRFLCALPLDSGPWGVLFCLLY